MGDANYYPDRWKEYVSVIKKSGGVPSQAWGTFAARYRVAGNYAGVNFFKMTGPSVAGYDRGIHLLLCYSAFEAGCTALGVKPIKRTISSDSGFAKSARLALIKAFSKIPEPEFPLRAALSSAMLASKIDNFFRGEDTNLQPIASAIRHLFAHGVWTPHGGRMMSVKACNALSLLSQSILREADRILEEEFLRACASTNISSGA